MTALAKRFHGIPSFRLYFSFFILLGLCSRPCVTAFAAEQKPPVPPKAAETLPPPPSLATIPLADIASRATEVSNLISQLTTSAASNVQIENIAKSLPELSEQLDAQFAATKKSLEGEPTLETLQNEQQQWQATQLHATGWLNVLTLEATKLQDSLNQLAEWQKTWGNSRASAQAAKAPDPILQQIDATLAAIAAAQKKVQGERTALLDLQSRVAQEVTKCGTALAQIGQFQQKAVAGILVPDAPPIWRVELWGDTLAALSEHVRKAAVAHWADIVRYLREPHKGAAQHALLFVVLALVFSAARRKIDIWEKSDQNTSSAILVFERPYAAASATVLVFATSPFFQMPTAVRQLLTVLVLVPLLRLMRPMVTASFASAMYAFCFLFAVDLLRQAFAGVQIAGQAILVAETLAAIIVLFWLRYYYRQEVAKSVGSSRLNALKLGRLLLTTVLVVALVAGVAGYARLARLLTPGVLVSVVLALAAFAYVRVIGGVVALALRVWPLSSLEMVVHHRELLERKIYRLLIWMAVMGWLVRYLSYLGLLDPAWSLVHALLATKLERGSIAVSIGNVLEFFLTVWFAYLLSRFLRFVLQEDVYPRINLAPGLSYAFSSLLNYIILALGFIAGLGLLGVDFSKVSILAGAFGVGIGFGLQGVVNNFVSGLILLFERPIHVDDIVEVGNLRGTVRRIGIRASVVHTWAGADIVVPNSQLVTEKVTNWTLSDRLRRIEIPVGVNYGADPKRVIELLEQLARAHPDVLSDPAPRALLMGFGDSSVNFELRAWPSNFHKWRQLRSDLAVAVFDAVKASPDMSFPFPQREVRLLRDPQADSGGKIVKPTAARSAEDKPA